MSDIYVCEAKTLKFEIDYSYVRRYPNGESISINVTRIDSDGDRHLANCITGQQAEDLLSILSGTHLMSELILKKEIKESDIHEV